MLSIDRVTVFNLEPYGYTTIFDADEQVYT